MRWFRFPFAGLALLWILAGTPSTHAQEKAPTEVDLALVIAVDISYSMDPDEQQLQREGYAQAFRDSLVHQAIRDGGIGRIAVTYMEWSGADSQWVELPWTVLDNPESILAFADQIAGVPLRRAHLTSISGAIDRASRLLGASGLTATRRVIDVSGDGPNNNGRPVVQARDEATAKGIVINGLPIMLKAPGYFDIPDLDRYYRDCVIGGPGAFMVPARERTQFQEAIRMKILREVSSAPGPLIQPTQAQVSEPPANCMVGEEQWRGRSGN